MRLGFHYHIPALLENAQILMPGHQGRFVDALADHCTEVICFLHTPLPAERQQMDYALRNPNVRLVSLGPHASVPRRLLSTRRHARTLRDQSRGLDALLLRGPSPLLPALADAARPVPTTLLLVGDAVALVDDTRQPFWRREVIRLLWKWNHRRQAQVARRSLTFVNSAKLFRELRPRVSHLIETRTTTLTRDDFFDRQDTCTRTPYRLLYTGRMTRGKGLIEMAEALALLARQGHDVVLDLVGWPEKNDDALEEMGRVAARLGIGERVKFHGPKPAGPELYAHYRNSDIYLIASKSSEGFPRTIWEAMAHSLPVVATAVGSIPEFAGAAAMVVEPNNPQALYRGIRALLHDGQRRRVLIEAGRHLASTVTLEQQVATMVRAIRDWICAGEHGATCIPGKVASASQSPAA